MKASTLIVQCHDFISANCKYEDAKEILDKISEYLRSRTDKPWNKKYDNINHPTHYNSHPSGVECITITECMNFCVGNAIKYLWRAGLKENTLEDLKKARWCIDREISRIEAYGDL